MRILKARVAEAQAKVAKSKAPVAQTYLSITFFLTWFFLSYFGLYYSTNAFASILICISLGFAIAGLGFNVFHDSIHGSISKHAWANRVLAFLSCSILGPSRVIWKHKHNYLHHQFTNIQDWDDDLETRGALRLSPSQPWLEKYRFQNIYAPFIYALTTLEWVFFNDFVRYFKKKINPSQRLPRLTVGDHVEFWISKIICIVFTVVLPLHYFSVPAFILGFLIAHSVASIILAVVFQLAHVMNESQFPISDPSSGKMNMDWVHLQLATTVNFAPTNRLLNWYCGGLNFQIEHHLLPRIHHSHYRNLAHIVETTAKEFGYPYHTQPTHWHAIRDHFGMLKKLSRPSLDEGTEQQEVGDSEEQFASEML